ncbi:MAG: DUF3352 domain-containing protein [Leptolyngbyaceae bacterium]|nr:DUF3352 domain-containing protein [Leptolyngbyaceae bacterium]
MANKKTSALLVTVGVAIALTAGGGLAWWFLKRQPSVGDGSSLGKLSMVPDTALATISVSTDEAQWQQVRSFGTVDTQTRFNSQLALWRDRLLTDNGLNYAEDIQPWVGEKITIVVFPPEVEPINPESPDPGDAGSAPDEDGIADSENSPPPEDAETPPDDGGVNPELIDPDESQAPVLLLPIADPLKAQSILQEALAAAGEGAKRDYNGVEIQSFSVDGDGSAPYFATVLDRQMLALTTDDRLLEQVIDTHQGEQSVLDIPGYDRAAEQVSTPDSFIDMYVNSAAAATLAAANTVQATPPQGLDVLQQGQGIAASVMINDEGLTFNGLTWLKQDAPTPYQPGKSAEQVLDKLPQDTLVMVAGSSFKQLWDTLDQRSSEGIKGPLNPENIRSGFQTLTGLNIDTDLVGWMTGGFSLALVNAPETPEASPTVGLVILAESGDRPTADKTFAQLDEVMRDRYQFQVTPKTISDIAVTDWAAPFGSLVVTRAWVDDTAVITLGNITESLMPKPTNSLGNDPLFQQATGNNASNANGYFFVNLEALINGKNNLPIPPLPPEQVATLSAFRAIGFTTDIQDETTARFNITVMMAKLDNPGSLPDLSPEENQVSPEDGTDGNE